MKKIYIIATISAVACAMLLFIFLQNYEKKGGSGSIQDKIAKEKIVTVVVAQQEIPENTQITAEMLTKIQVPQSAANYDAFNSPNAVVGKFTNVKILPKEQVLRAKVYDEKTGNNDSLALGLGSDVNVDEDSRAITLNVDLEQGVGGYVQKGDFVDVLAAKSDSENPQVWIEGAYIIRIGDQHYTAEAGVYTSVTIACSMEDCQKLYRLQSSKGAGWSFSFVLRPKK
ncbi:MAG: Flp pilus assembly protein CpaB [Eubacterium sp.]|nr:Flp pilus assembly protein CpaB [Eubacterium sp.]